MLLKDVTKYQFYSIQRNQLIWTQYRSVQNMFNLGKATPCINRICIVRCVYRTRFSCSEPQNPITSEPSGSENIWVTFAYGFVAVTIINLSSIGGLMIVPLMNKRAYHRGRFHMAPNNKGRHFDFLNKFIMKSNNSTFIFHCHGCFCPSFKRFISFDSAST